MKRKTKGFFQRLTSPLRFLLALILTFCLSSVGRATERVKRTIKSKKNNLKASYQTLLTTKAWAYFRPSWNTSSTDSLSLIQNFESLTSDPENRVDKPFRIKSALRKRVAFWISIYGQFTSQYRVLHDKDNPEIIYGYIDFTSLYRSMPRPMARARAHQMEERIVAELKERLAEAMELSNPKEPRLTPEEKTEIREMLARYDIRNAADLTKPLRRVRAQTGQRDFFLKGIQRSQKVMAEIEKIFQDRGLPVALARLPFVESSFNRGAISKAGAIGMWQFLPETARRFAPRDTERDLSDPIRQSRSAARMFTILHEKFDDWGLAVTAYNSGAVRVKRIADTYDAQDIERLLKVPLGRGKLGFAGSNFFCEFLAAVFVEAYKDRIFTPTDFQLASIDLPRHLESLMDTGPANRLTEVAKAPKAARSAKKADRPKPKLARETKRLSPESGASYTQTSRRKSFRTLH